MATAISNVLPVATVVAVVLGVLELIEIWTGWQSGVTEEWILSVLAVITPLIIWLGRE